MSPYPKIHGERDLTYGMLLYVCCMYVNSHFAYILSITIESLRKRKNFYIVLPCNKRVVEAFEIERVELSDTKAEWSSREIGRETGSAGTSEKTCPRKEKRS